MCSAPDNSTQLRERERERENHDGLYTIVGALNISTGLGLEIHSLTEAGSHFTTPLIPHRPPNLNETTINAN